MITDFVEKPADPPAMPASRTSSLASMGIYVFNARYLLRELGAMATTPDSSHDFGKDIIPPRWYATARAPPTRSISRAATAGRARSRTGATSAPSTPTGTPTSTSPPPTRC